MARGPDRPRGTGAPGGRSEAGRGGPRGPRPPREGGENRQGHRDGGRDGDGREGKRLSPASRHENARPAEKPWKRAEGAKSDRRDDAGGSSDRRFEGAGRASSGPVHGHSWRESEPAGSGAPSQRADDKLLRVAGLPSVVELFETGADRVERLYFDAGMKAQTRGYCELLARRRKVYRLLGDDEMRRVAGTVMHGGIVALARPRPIRDFDSKLAEGWAAAGEPLLVLDGIGNPQNIGAIARTAAFFGVQRLVLSDHPGQAGLSDAAYRIAKGGLDRLEIYRAVGLADTLRQIGRFYEVTGTAIENGKPMNMLPKSGKPFALVLGNEEDGLPPATLAACTSVVALAGTGRVQSLNVGAAAAILIHTLLARH